MYVIKNQETIKKIALLSIAICLNTTSLIAMEPDPDDGRSYQHSPKKTARYLASRQGQDWLSQQPSRNMPRSQPSSIYPEDVKENIIKTQRLTGITR